MMNLSDIQNQALGKFLPGIRDSLNEIPEMQADLDVLQKRMDQINKTRDKITEEYADTTGTVGEMNVRSTQILDMLYSRILDKNKNN